MLGVMGLPVTKSLADAASTERMNVTMLSEAAKVTMAGNGMDVPSVGFVMLTALICLEEKHTDEARLDTFSQIMFFVILFVLIRGHFQAFPVPPRDKRRKTQWGPKKFSVLSL
ncbi:unnamed protein product [Cladocopium goreaui]|uniref:E3 ubiquitin-protein ligase HERC2 n=1 Tax=Cladocopium goreaui TaxID=2562237 RepID=A0A9P1DSM9_9DINO|nr:unnamed protein product [Cladocopium goreaui]